LSDGSVYVRRRMTVVPLPRSNISPALPDLGLTQCAAAAIGTSTAGTHTDTYKQASIDTHGHSTL